jgi:signal transduction histidine kinase
VNHAESLPGSLEIAPAPRAVTGAALVLLAVVTWTAVPVLRQFDDALVPWPAHGLAVAILFSSQVRIRRWTVLGMLAAITVGAMIGGGTVFSSVAAAALVTAQTIVSLGIFELLSKGRPPLSSSTAYAWFLFVAIVGTLPSTLAASLIMQLVGPGIAPGYTTLVWWMSAMSSVAALSPLLLAAVTRRPATVKRSLWYRSEFTALCVVYSIALASAFLELGPLHYIVSPPVATLPFLTWAGLRFGVRGYAIVAAMLVTTAVIASIIGVGPFAALGPDALVRGQPTWTYLAALVGPAMIVPIGLTERAVAIEKVRAAHAQLSAIVEGSGDLIAAVDRDLAVIAANPAWISEFEKISGFVVRPGDRLDTIYRRGYPAGAEESIDLWRRALYGERFTITRAFGSSTQERDEFEITYGPVRDANGDLVGASQVARNVTERRSRESQEAETRRLESVGRLAGGVAHDFNNLMTAVIGYTELIAATMPKDDPRREDLSQIERAASRAGELTQQLLAFARRRVIEPRVVDLGEIVEGFTRLLAPLLGRNITLTVRIEPGLRRVRVDPAQFEQVLMNLAVNARDAMPGGGRLEIEIINTVRDGRKGVRFTVRDSGTGMSEEVQARLWEPFFTTKPIGQGTGLGLPTVHGIVHQAGGDIAVESLVGSGSAFHVFFPEAGES